jgi:endo-1,4-beta-D-glucanase Y
MKNIYLFISLVFIANVAFAQRFPFPQHVAYHTHIKPGQFTQEQLDQQVKSYYDAWKNKYLKNGCESNQYYVFFDSGNTVTVSEAMGYGMMIIPLMAGYDENARMYFDGLYHYYKAHPSHIMPHLMAWKQITGCIDADGPDSATDGDIDIAFGLLLAHAQWGSNGAINYFREALAIINDIMGNNAAEGDINQNYYSIKLGDWVRSGSYMTGTRTSDFITDHFRAFQCATKDSGWYSVIDKCYNLINDIQTNYSPQTGLLPDFIVDVDQNAKPAGPGFLEGNNDGNYYYNACRDPWRLTNDYLISGDSRAKQAVLKLDKWLYNSTGGNVNKVFAGYSLDGEKLNSWSDNSFTAPFTAGAMLDTSNQDWLNKLYSKMLQGSTANGGYYDNTLRLLSMITISGNFWVPPCEILNGTKETKSIKSGFDIYPSPANESFSVNFNDDTKIHKLTIFDIAGNILLSVKTEGKTADIDIGNLAHGIYFITVNGAGGKLPETKKLIKN